MAAWGRMLALAAAALSLSAATALPGDFTAPILQVRRGTYMQGVRM